MATFFLLCRSFCVDWSRALLAACAYGSVYYVWFAAEIHSAYAAETLMPVLTLLCFQKLARARSMPWAIAAALAASGAIALRPSDGFFVLPLWAFLLVTGRYSFRLLVTFAVVLLTTFIAWYVPSNHALHAIGLVGSVPQLLSFARMTSVLFAGITPRSLANVSRVFLPLAVAFWMLVPALLRARTRQLNATLALWMLPGLLFFTLLCMADPTYLVYCTGAVVLACAVCADRRLVVWSLLLCCVWSTGIFVCATPTNSTNLAREAWTFYVTKYSAHGLQLQWKGTLGRAAQAQGRFLQRPSDRRYRLE